MCSGARSEAESDGVRRQVTATTTNTRRASQLLRDEPENHDEIRELPGGIALDGSGAQIEGTRRGLLWDGSRPVRMRGTRALATRTVVTGRTPSGDDGIGRHWDSDAHHPA